MFAGVRLGIKEWVNERFVEGIVVHTGNLRLLLERRFGYGPLRRRVLEAFLVMEEAKKVVSGFTEHAHSFSVSFLCRRKVLQMPSEDTKVGICRRILGWALNAGYIYVLQERIAKAIEISRVCCL